MAKGGTRGVALLVGAGFAAFAAARFGLRAVAQSMARELAPKNIHVAHLIIVLIQTSSIAEAYWALHAQSRDGWAHELDLRPYNERW
jgi:NAD(P)-dependent dehydrogenase (short-subunit alcohol dehydrogenase family)